MVSTMSDSGSPECKEEWVMRVVLYSSSRQCDLGKMSKALGLGPTHEAKKWTVLVAEKESDR